MISKKHKKISTTLNYIEHCLISVSKITGYISISAFVSLLGIPIGNASYVIGLKICAIAAGNKKYKSIMKEKKHDKRVLQGKSRLIGIEVFIAKALIDSNISHDEFILINNVLKEFDDMKEDIKNLKIQIVHRRF